MNWDAVGAVGELLSALAVLITLIYLTVQVKHGKELLEENRKIAMSQVYQKRADSRSHLRDSVLQSSELAELFAGIDEGGVDEIRMLSVVQRKRLWAFYEQQVVHLDNNLYQAEMGLLDDGSLEGTLRAIERDKRKWEELGLILTPRIEAHSKNDGGIA